MTAPTRTSARPMQTSGRFALLAASTITGLRSKLRTPEFAVGAIAIPALLYAMFGLPKADSVLPGGTTVAQAMLVSIGAYGVVSLAIFTFGEDVAKDRGDGWLRTLRATPIPVWSHLVGKTASAVVLAAMIVASLAVLATLAGVRLPAAAWAALALALVAGVLLFSTLGFAIAFLVRPRAAATIANLVFLPLAFASGFFMPMGELPQVLQTLAAYLPTFHYGQLIYPLVMPEQDVVAWTGAQMQPAWVHVLWVLLPAVALGALALWAARREAVTSRG